MIDEKVIDEEVKSTKSLIQTFLQTLKSYQVYETSHPMLSRFLDRLKQEFDGYFDKLESLILQVGQLQLLYRGNVVYESPDAKESLAFLFFKDGIREIRFFKGLELEEIVDFLNVVRKSTRVNRMEDDLVTLLWEKDFFHIEFTIVDEFWEGGGVFIPVKDEDFLKGLEYRGFGEESTGERGGSGAASGGGSGAARGGASGPARGDASHGGSTGTEGAYGFKGGGLAQGLHLSPDRSLAQICELDPNELEKIYEKAHEEEQPEYLYALINNLIEILLHLGETTDAYENVISYFDGLIKSFVEDGEIGEAVAILKDLQDTTASLALKEKQASAIGRILEIPSSSSCVELFGKALKEREADSESILLYLGLLTEQAVDPLCYLLKELERKKWRMMVCERLVELCKEEIELLIKFLSDSDPSFVCRILYILERVEHPSTLKYVGDLVYHEDRKVREEVLKLITKFGEKGKGLIQGFLQDSVPEIRGKASLIFARMAKEGAVKHLTEIILSEDFHKRDYGEKASFFKALAETGAEEAIPILKEIVKKRSWIKKRKWDEMRLCAANALRMMGVGKGDISYR